MRASEIQMDFLDESRELWLLRQRFDDRRRPAHASDSGVSYIVLRVEYLSSQLQESRRNEASTSGIVFLG